MELSINKNLTLGDVTCKIWNWMGDIVILYYFKYLQAQKELEFG